MEDLRSKLVTEADDRVTDFLFVFEKLLDLGHLIEDGSKSLINFTINLRNYHNVNKDPDLNSIINELSEVIQEFDSIANKMTKHVSTTGERAQELKKHFNSIMAKYN